MGHDHKHEHDDGEHHHHGHENDQGISGALRYLRWAPQMWRSDLNMAVVAELGPTKGERVLDIGAGMGAGAVAALKTGALVTAVEPTPFMHRILTVRRLFQRGRKRLTIVAGSAETLPVADQTVDAIYAVNTMHHWVDPERGAAEIARVLKPTGRVVLIDEDFENPDHPDHERFGNRHGDDGHHGFTMVDAARMGELLEAAGLTDVVARDRDFADRPAIAVFAGFSD